MDISENKISKSEKTRQAILEKALHLFEKENYESVTMRSLAASCDLSLGAFYYHFKSKEEVILEFYQTSLGGHIDRTKEYLNQKNLRLEDVMIWICRDRFKEFKHYRSILRVLAQRLDSQDPTSPWHSSSQPIREKSVELFTDVVMTCIPNLDNKTARPLGRGLWLHHLIIVGFWTFDRSSKEKNTEEILNQSAKIWKSLPTLLKVPGFKSHLPKLLSPLSRLEKGEH